MKKNKIVRMFFNWLYKFRLPEMVQYWKTGDMARAKLTTLKDGSYAMVIEGEKYPLYGFPRGPVLYGPLAKLKHMVKNLIFNEVWKLLEEGKTNEEIMAYVKDNALPIILGEINKSRYDFFPPHKMCPSVKELYRGLTNAGVDETLTQGICFFFQEDDAYRFRFQWVAKYLNPRNIFRKIYRFITGKSYSFAKETEAVMNFLTESEIVPDMRGRIKLIKRVLFAFLEDKEFGELIKRVVWELDWKKLKLSKADTYYFRGKYFKVDNDKFDY